MKLNKLIALGLAGCLALAMTACGGNSAPAATTAATAAEATAAATTAAAAEAATEAAKLSGTVTLAGSTSMQKLCEAMIESFEEVYPDITDTAGYDRLHLPAHGGHICRACCGEEKAVHTARIQRMV